MGRILSIVILLGGFALATHASAQETSTQRATAPVVVDRVEALKAAAEGDTAGGLEPQVISPDVLGEAGTAALHQAMTAYYQYRIDGYHHRQNVFRWQLISSVIIFVLVAFLVLIGVYFSWLQFRAALVGTPADMKETSFEASTTGLKVSSPILGVIILALSLAFFYLYLVHVYPITDVL